MSALNTAEIVLKEEPGKGSLDEKKTDTKEPEQESVEIVEEQKESARDIYFRNKARKKKIRRRVALLSVVVVVLIAGVFGFFAYRFFSNIRPGVTIEAGESLPSVDDFLYDPGRGTKCDTDLTKISSREPGDYPVEFSWLFFREEAILTVQDTVAPTGEVKDMICKIGEKPKAEDFVVSMSDETDISVRYVLEPILNKEGTRKVSILLEDKGGNQTILKANLTLYDETNVPVIKGAKDIHIFTGDSVSYRAGVSVLSKLEPAPQLVIDNSKVNLDKPGVYPVTYSATDQFGRTGTVTINLEIEDKPEDYDDMILMNEKADQLIASIITPDMNDMEKLFAIFRWIRLNIPWSGGRSEHNEIQQVINGLDGKPGDCYTDAMTMKVLLDRVGIRYIMIEKNDETGMHYWLMVQYEGNWYHVDPTPVYITQFVTFLSTDAQIQIDSDKYRPHFYDRDTRYYPTTPVISPCKVVYNPEVKDYFLEVGDWLPGADSEGIPR